MHPNQNNLNLPAYPLAATRRIRANRVGLGNLERYLDSIPNDDDGGAGGGGGAAQQNEAWMNDVGLALAATKHRERREARAAAMLEIVDIGQAFPANSAASSPNTNSPREPLSSNPRTPHSTHGLIFTLRNFFATHSQSRKSSARSSSGEVRPWL